MNFKYQAINITDIDLDKENPRFPSVNNQRDAIQAMLEEQGEKLYVLGKDISQYGLDPSKRLIVFKNNNRFIDGDGNRRMTVLKILETPSMINDNKLYDKFKILSKSMKGKEIKTVECVVFSSRNEIKHWLEINHDGFQNGRGQIPWSSEQKERFNGSKSIGMIAKEKLLFENLITQKEHDSVNVTTLTRLLGSRPAKKALSITNDTQGVTFADMGSLLKIFKALENKSVKEVYHDEDRKIFLLNYLGSLDGKENLQTSASENSSNVQTNKKINKKTKRISNQNKPIFGEVLLLKEGIVNNIYRDICDIYDLSKKSDKFVEILGFSMRLILDVAAREYFSQNPKVNQKQDAIYKEYLKLIKGQILQKDKTTLSVDKSIKNLIEEENVEALLGKLAHASIRTSHEMVLNLSYIIGPILKIHFSKENS